MISVLMRDRRGERPRGGRGGMEAEAGVTPPQPRNAWGPWDLEEVRKDPALEPS